MLSKLLALFALIFWLAVPAVAQPGCRTVVLPELVNTPASISTTITVPPATQVGIYYPFTYSPPANGTTTGVETAFYRLVTTSVIVNDAQQVPRSVPFVQTPTGWQMFEPESVHVWYYQTLPHPPGITDAESIPYLRTQYHSTKLEDFQNLSVVLQPPKNGQTGDGWTTGFLNFNSFPVLVEHQVFFRECVTP